MGDIAYDLDRTEADLNSLEKTKAVILAGGRGTRLAPFTSVLPKPLMPVGDRSILEIVVSQLEAVGIVDINFCVGYLSHLIQAVFDSRQNGRVDITYVREQDALGTAAPLRLVSGLDDTFLVMNGDVLTTLDYADLVRFHRRQGNMVTIATYNRSIQIDYGMLQIDVSQRVRAFNEKPEITSPVSMGVYVMEPETLSFIPEGEYFDFPDLIQELLAADERVGAYRFEGAWFDIGRHEDYDQAVSAWSENGHLGSNGNGYAAANGNGYAAANGNGRTSNGNGRGHVTGNTVGPVAGNGLATPIGETKQRKKTGRPQR